MQKTTNQLFPIINNSLILIYEYCYWESLRRENSYFKIIYIICATIKNKQDIIYEYLKNTLIILHEHTHIKSSNPKVRPR